MWYVSVSVFSWSCYKVRTCVRNSWANWRHFRWIVVVLFCWTSGFPHGGWGLGLGGLYVLTKTEAQVCVCSRGGWVTLILALQRLLAEATVTFAITREMNGSSFLLSVFDVEGAGSLPSASHLCSTVYRSFAEQSAVVRGTAEGGHAVLGKGIFLHGVWWVILCLW